MRRIIDFVINIISLVMIVFAVIIFFPIIVICNFVADKPEDSYKDYL